MRTIMDLRDVRGPQVYEEYTSNGRTGKHTGLQ